MYESVETVYEGLNRGSVALPAAQSDAWSVPIVDICPGSVVAVETQQCIHVSSGQLAKLHGSYLKYGISI